MRIFGGPGVFGSVSRNRAYKESDVDIFIVLKELGRIHRSRESMHTFPEQLHILF